MLNIAHIREEGTNKVQTLEEHLKGTSVLCESFLNGLGIGNVGKTTGLLHDLGKACESFNQYISGEESYARGEIDHSTAGAQFLHDYCGACNSPYEKIALEMMEHVIMSHHSGMVNYISADGQAFFPKRMGKDIDKTHLDEAIERLDKGLMREIRESVCDAVTQFADVLENIYNGKKEQTMFRFGLLNRMVLSSLIDADRIDTISFQNNSAYSVRQTDWDKLRTRFEEKISHFDGTDRISKIRKKISDECLVASANKPGIFTLSVPTGGGKTLSSFRFAINHLCENKMERIIYVVPYLSILEQNVNVIRRMINNDGEPDYVTECHSNVDVADDGLEDDASEKTSWGSPMDSWDGPVVFTSMVQFLEVLFASGTKRIRRMHNLSNAVIVFDEIQNLPIKAVYMFNEAVNFLCKHCGSSAVLCTATQPCLGDSTLSHPIDTADATEIVSDVGNLFDELKRTRFHYVNQKGLPMESRDVADMALEIIPSVESILIIVNTKRMAREVFEALKYDAGSDVALFHLSTNMCSTHRKTVFERMTALLGNEKVICVSTQLIEAGVDIDFNVVIRSMAGLDSISQAAGRCNRNAKSDCGDVYIVRTDEKLSNLKDIEEGRRCSESLLRDETYDIITPGMMNDYYGRYFFKREPDMSYKSSVFSEQTLFGMLSTNTIGTNTLKNSTGSKNVGCIIHQAFMDANKEFKVIETNRAVVVPYDEIARDAIATLCSDRILDERRNVMRTLQRYTVNVFNLDNLLKERIVSEVRYPGGSLFCLSEGYYDEEIGIIESAKHEILML